MSTRTMKKTLSLAMGATFAAVITASPIANADTNPFGMQKLNNGYMQLADAKCGAKMMKENEGKCGANKMKKMKMEQMKKEHEGKCGANKMKKKINGKCGSGKCGANKMKRMKMEQMKKEHEGKCGANK